jgi:hypothetical protein
MSKRCRRPDHKDTLLREATEEFLAKATEIGYVIQQPCEAHGDNDCACEKFYRFNQDLTPEQIAAMQHQLESMEDPTDL